jgi:hypothetical protein
MGVLSRDAAAAAKASSGVGNASSTTLDGVDAAADGFDSPFDIGHEPVMFCVHDAKLGEVSILHGTDEVVVKDPQLVRRIMHAASRRKL